jgi:hypothetical protein
MRVSCWRRYFVPTIAKAKQHLDKAKDAKLRSMFTKGGRKASEVNTLDLSTRRARLVALGVDEATYRACGGTVDD